MAISYTWDCKTCDTYPTKSGKSNVVYNVHWRLTGTDDTNTVKDNAGNDVAATATVYGTQQVATDDLSSFTNWSSLSESTVQGWVETAMGADEVASHKSSVDTSISQKISPKSVTKELG